MRESSIRNVKKPKKKSYAQWKAKLKRKLWAENKFGELQDDKRQKLMEANAAKMRAKMTEPERVMESLLKEMKLEYKSQHILGDFIYDFYIPGYKLLIEVDGDYFHGHPDKYIKAELNPLQKKIKRNDMMKDQLAVGTKHGLLRFWECDINDDIAFVQRKLKAFFHERDQE